MLKHLTGLLICLCAAAVLCAGCASKWSPVIESAAQPPRWVDQSNIARATYVETITGFRETGTNALGVLKSIMFGNRASDNSIRRPVAVAVGPDDRMAIADPGRPCVHLYVPSEQKYRRIYRAGKDALQLPVSVAFDKDLKLYVSDSSRHAIYVFDREGTFLSAINKAGNDALLRPTGLSYFPGNKLLYVVDTIGGKVYALDAAGALLFSFGGVGEQRGQFNFPTHIVTSPDGHLYITDAMNFRIQVFDASGRFLSSFGRHGNGSGDFSLPKGIAVDKAGIIYVVDSLFDTIQLFDVDGNFLFTFGGSGTGAGEFWLPSGLFLDERDKLYVCDTYNQRVQIFQIMRNQ